jgi:RNA polymerase sigma-70 factor (ECF subfamily)
MASVPELTERFFRRESVKMVAALTRIFGVHNLAIVEDVVQDAFARALEVWKARGIPENPAAWLMTAAKNRAIDRIRRERTARMFAPELSWLAPKVDEAFDERTIREEQVKMMFSCCHPSLAEEAQLALILNILCAFSPNEIANAFLTGRPAIEKRISRAKHTLARAKRLFDLGDAEFASRLSTVQRALYLLFNEGYHGASAVRAELCAEAMRLTALLRQHPLAATSATVALAALMALHAARLPARVDATGDLSSLVDQDRSQWDTALTAEGLALLESSARGDEVTSYHIEAAIAAVHASARTLDETDWPKIVSLYDRLFDLAPSPTVALNRAIAIGERDGPSRGLEALGAIADVDRLSPYPFYPAAMGEFARRLGAYDAARAHFQAAISRARNAAERRFLQKRLSSIDVRL